MARVTFLVIATDGKDMTTDNMIFEEMEFLLGPEDDIPDYDVVAAVFKQDNQGKDFEIIDIREI